MTTIKYNTKEAALAAVLQDGTELRFCSKELKKDEEVVMVAIKQISWTFCYASKALKSNKTFILKAINEGVDLWKLIQYTTLAIQSDIEVMSLAIEKSDDGWEFKFAKRGVAFNKELAAKALVKWGNLRGYTFSLWNDIHPTLKEFFPKDSWCEKALAYLHHIEQSKTVLGGCTDEDGVVW